MKIPKGKYLGCGAYDSWWVKRNVRHAIFERYKKPVPDEILDKIFEIIEMGEEKK